MLGILLLDTREIRDPIRAILEQEGGGTVENVLYRLQWRREHVLS